MLSELSGGAKSIGHDPQRLFGAEAATTEGASAPSQADAVINGPALVGVETGVMSLVRVEVESTA